MYVVSLHTESTDSVICSVSMLNSCGIFGAIKATAKSVSTKRTQTRDLVLSLVDEVRAYKCVEVEMHE